LLFAQEYTPFGIILSEKIENSLTKLQAVPDITKTHKMDDSDGVVYHFFYYTTIKNNLGNTAKDENYFIFQLIERKGFLAGWSIYAKNGTLITEMTKSFLKGYEIVSFENTNYSYTDSFLAVNWYNSGSDFYGINFYSNKDCADTSCQSLLSQYLGYLNNYKIYKRMSR